jgi:hypothetical protein
MPAFNAQNDTGSPQSNKQNIKYPYYVAGQAGNTYGIPFMDSVVQSVYNSAGPKGFFVTGGTQGNWTAQTASNQITGYTVTSNYVVDMTTLSGQTVINILLSNPICSPTSGTPSINDYITIFLDGNGGCSVFESSPILTYRIQDISPTIGTSGTTVYSVTLDRNAPDFTGIAPTASTCRALIYPSTMTQLYCNTGSVLADRYS